MLEEIQRYLATGEAPRAARELPRRTEPRRRRRRRLQLRHRLGRVWANPKVRVIAVVALVVVGTVIARRHTATATATDGPDHASAAPAGPNYSFENVNRSGTPMRWNPCKPIHLRVNLAEAPPNAAADLTTALQAVSTATGMTFVEDGATSVVPTRAWQRSATMRRSAVVIAWASASQTDVFGTDPFGREVGVGGPGAVIDPATGHGVYVSGLVVIDRDASARLAPGFGTRSIGLVLMHELGHLVGLGHTPSTADIMNPTIQPTRTGTWGAGDLAGLARLGIQSGCLKVPSRQTVTIY